MKMDFVQCATVLNSIVSQAKGGSPLAAIDTHQFVSQAHNLLESGYDPVLNALSQTLSKTIFSMRAYEGSFHGLMVDNITYGNHVRKVNYLDSQWINDDRYNLYDNDSVDQQVVAKPTVYQTNLFGESVYEKPYTIFKDQLDVAFNGPDEFARFVEGVVLNTHNTLVQAREEQARATLANLIAAKQVVSTLGHGGVHCVKLCTEFFTELGGPAPEDPFASIRNPEVFPIFSRWMVGRLVYYMRLFTARSEMFTVRFRDPKDGRKFARIPRNTPFDKQKLIVSGKFMDAFRAEAQSVTFNDEFLKLNIFEEVPYFQSIQAPDSINVKPSYMADEHETENNEAVNIPHVFGILMDEEAAGVTNVNQWIMPAPFNARGGYTTWWMHETHRHWNDMTENALVFLLA